MQPNCPAASAMSCCVVVHPQAVRRLWALIKRSVESAVSRQPDRPRAAVEKEVKGRYLVLDTKQRSLSLSQEGMALLFSLLLQEPDVVFRCGRGVTGGRLQWVSCAAGHGCMCWYSRLHRMCHHAAACPVGTPTSSQFSLA
jgi:hypothetical protein